MAPDGITGVGVFMLAMFMAPALASMVPDFDPLLGIIALFAVLAGLQHLSGMGKGQPQDDGHGPSAAGRRTRQQSGGGGHGAREAAEPKPGSPAHIKQLIAEAERCMEQNSYSKVQEVAQKITDFDPENARAWELLATAQKWDGKRDEAKATVKRARDLYEVESEGLKMLAKELGRTQKPAVAAAEVEKKAEDFLAKRQYDLAAECYTKALEALGEGDADAALRPQRLRMLRRRAECAQQLQDWTTCRADATELLEEDPGDARALLQRAASNEALEKFKAALEDARRLLAVDPRSAAANRIVHNCQQALRD